MMNKKFLIIVLCMFFLTSCNNKIDNFVKDTKKEVTNSIKNTSKEKITKSIKYINDNYEKKIDKNFVYNTLLLKKLCDNTYLKDNKIKRVAEASYEYMFRQSKGNKKELKDSLDGLYKNFDDEVNNFYLMYQRLAIVDGYLAKAKTKLIIEAEEKDFISNKKINIAIDYIRDYYDNAFKNNEVIERLGYYSMYLEKIGDKTKIDNSIISLGKTMKKYLQNGKDRDFEKVKELLDEVSNNRNSLVEEISAN